MATELVVINVFFATRVFRTCKLETIDIQDNRRCGRLAKDENFKRIVPGALEGSILKELRYVRKKVDSFSPRIPRRQGQEQSGNDKIFCEDNFTSSSTPRAQQIMPRGFRQFWLHYRSSLDIQALRVNEDIDSFSIEIIREHNKPRVALPSLRGKIN